MQNLVFFSFDNEILMNREKAHIKVRNMRQAPISVPQIKIYNFTLFATGTTNSVKNSIGCVIMIKCHGSNPYLTREYCSLEGSLELKLII